MIQLRKFPLCIFFLVVLGGCSKLNGTYLLEVAPGETTRTELQVKSDQMIKTITSPEGCQQKFTYGDLKLTDKTIESGWVMFETSMCGLGGEGERKKDPQKYHFNFRLDDGFLLLEVK